MAGDHLRVPLSSEGAGPGRSRVDGSGLCSRGRFASCADDPYGCHRLTVGLSSARRAGARCLLASTCRRTSPPAFPKLTVSAWTVFQAMSALLTV